MASWKRVITTDDNDEYLNSNVDATDIDANVSNTEFGYLNGVTSSIQDQIDSASTSGGLSDEEVQDIVGGMLSSNTETNISVSYDDTNNHIDFIVPTVSALSKGVIGIGYTTSGKNYKLQIDANGNGYVNVPWTDSNELTTEEVQDIVGAMVDGGTETRVAVTYDDTNGKLNFEVDDMTANTFRTVEVDTDGDGSADETLGATETLRLVKGNNITLGESAGKVTISGTGDTTYTAGTGMSLSVANEFSIGQAVGTSDNVSFGNIAGANVSGDRLDIDDVRIDGGAITVTNASSHLDISAGTNGEVRIQDSLYVSGGLTVAGTTTTVNTEEIKLADNTIVLNSNATGTPSEDGGIEIERGDRTNVNFVWDESALEWTSQVYLSSANDDTAYNGKVPVIERASTGTSGSDTTVGSMFINTATGNFYIYS